jgi:hypothetical protein
MSMAMIFVWQKQKLQTQIQTALLTYKVAMGRSENFMSSTQHRTCMHSITV